MPTPVEQTAGTAFNVTVTATDEWGNKTVGYTGSKTLAWSGPSKSPSGLAPSYPSTATAVTFTEGVGTATAITLYDAQSTTLTVKEGTLAGTSAAFTVKAAGASSFSVPAQTEKEAGVAFNVTVTAWDTWHNTANSYAGSKTLAWSGPKSSPSGLAPGYPSTATTVTFIEGVGTATAITLYDAQSTTLKAEEGTIAGTSAAFTVKGGRDNQEVHRAHSGRTDGGHRLQRDPHRHRRMGQQDRRLYGLKDARLERPEQLAERTGAQLPEHGDGGHLHRRRGHGHRDHAV